MDKESRWYLLGVEARRAGRAHGDNPLPLPAAAFFVASEPRSGECRWMHGGGLGGRGPKVQAFILDPRRRVRRPRRVGAVALVSRWLRRARSWFLLGHGQPRLGSA